jgi:hypothetical protein
MLEWYLSNGFEVWIVGDLVENWQFPDVRMCLPAGCVRLIGNHDAPDPLLPEALIIDEFPPILVTHGHFGEFLCDQGAWLGNFLVRYLWTPLEKIGVKEPTSPSGMRHARQRVDLLDWANNNQWGARILCGHVHLQEVSGRYWNMGCTVDGKADAIELEAGIPTLASWASGQRLIL